jgi:hypothetical protein
VAIAELPPQLLQRLSSSEAVALDRLCNVFGEELQSVYQDGVEDHRPTRGDNAKIFGIRIYDRLGFRLTGRLAGDQDNHVSWNRGGFMLLSGPLQIGAYKLGRGIDDNVFESIPDGSDRKRSFGEDNVEQLEQLSLLPRGPLPNLSPGERYSLNHLVFGHFGNPIDSLAKWYLGAFLRLKKTGESGWAWVERQDDFDEGVESTPKAPDIPPFSERSVEDLVVRPRIRRTGTD